MSPKEQYKLAFRTVRQINREARYPASSYTVQITQAVYNTNSRYFTPSMYRQAVISYFDRENYEAITLQ